MLNLLSDQPRFAQCKGLDAGSFIRRASRKPSNTARNLLPPRHRSSLIRSLSSSILRSSAPNTLLSSCRASSMACFSFLMVFTIPARTSRASGDLSIPEMISFSVVWRMSIHCCRICQALPDSPLRRRSSNCDEMRAFSLSVSFFISATSARALARLITSQIGTAPKSDCCLTTPPAPADSQSQKTPIS